jgi:hypothetical protein
LRRRSLLKALRAVGTVAGLARRLLVSESTVRAWLREAPRKVPKVRGAIVFRPGDEPVLRAAMKQVGPKRMAESLGITLAELRLMARGIPDREQTPDWRLESLLREISGSKRKSTEETNIFNELLKLSGEVTTTRARRGRGGKVVSEVVASMPVIRSKEGKRSGKRTVGYFWVKAFRRELSPAVIREIEAWTHTLKSKGFPLWQGTALLSQYALHPTKNFDSGSKPGSPKAHTVIVRLPHQEAGSFAAQVPVPTRATRVKSDMTADLIGRLGEIDDDELLRSFVHSVRVLNYKRRTDEEITKLETRQRSERRRKFEWRKKRAKAKRKTRKKTSKKKQTKTKKRSPRAGRAPLRGAMRPSAGRKKRVKKRTKKTVKRKKKR